MRVAEVAKDGPKKELGASLLELSGRYVTAAGAFHEGTGDDTEAYANPSGDGSWKWSRSAGSWSATPQGRRKVDIDVFGSGLGNDPVLAWVRQDNFDNTSGTTATTAANDRSGSAASIVLLLLTALQQVQLQILLVIFSLFHTVSGMAPCWPQTQHTTCDQ